MALLPKVDRDGKQRVTQWGKASGSTVSTLTEGELNCNHKGPQSEKKMNTKKRGKREIAGKNGVGVHLAPGSYDCAKLKWKRLKDDLFIIRGLQGESCPPTSSHVIGSKVCAGKS